MIALLLFGSLSVGGLGTARAGDNPLCPYPTPTGQPGALFVYCGQHWQRSALPLRVKVPQNLLVATTEAAKEWDPGAAACGTASILCVVTSETSKVTVSWSNNLGGCAGNAGTATPTADPLTRRLLSFQVLVNQSCLWDFSALQTIEGVAQWVAGGGCIQSLCGNSMDLQGLLAHELGHVLGLGDVNPGLSACAPGDLTDFGQHLEVMYACSWQGVVSRRVVTPPDMAGLALSLADSAKD